MIASLLLASAVLATPVAEFDRVRAGSFDWIRVLRELPAPPPARATPRASAPAVVFAARGAEVIGEDRLWESLRTADVVYAGEQHDQETHHAVQLSALKALQARRPKLQVGLEMVDITQQSVLDDYIGGRLSDEEFARFWKKAWGYSFDLYRPILEYARENRIPVKGLNAPLAVVRQIAKGGLSSLTPEQRRLLPARVDPISDPRYLAYVKKSLEGHGPLDPVQEARMLEAMAAWNETMGQSVADALASGPMLVIAGSGHMLYGAGILESVRSRSPASQSVLLPYPLGGERLPLKDLLKTLMDPASGDAQLGDYFWLLPGD